LRILDLLAESGKFLQLSFESLFAQTIFFAASLAGHYVRGLVEIEDRKDDRLFTGNAIELK
jgi:hypothetical protein